MKRAMPTSLLAIVALLLLSASASAADFGLDHLEITSTAKNGSPAIQAGSHPYSLTTHVGVRVEEQPPGSGNGFPVGEPKDVRVFLPPGFIGNLTAVPRCSAALFLAGQAPDCPDSTALGVATVEIGAPAVSKPDPIAPLYNLQPSPGSAGKLGFIAEGVAPVTLDLSLNQDPPYNAVVTSTNISQGVIFRGVTIDTWGVPAAPGHDGERGKCLFSNASCPVSIAEVPFLTLPTNCEAPLSFGFEADSWQDPSPLGVPYPFKESVTVNDGAVPPNPLSPAGCAKLGFAPSINAKPTTKAASSPTGLDFSLDVDDEGFENPAEEATADSTIKSAVVTLPEGFSTNPSLAEGLTICSAADLNRETPFNEAGTGCPAASKIGTVEVETPVVDERIDGALYIAEPYANPFGTLLALYMVLKSPTLGVIVKQPLKVEADAVTGRITTIAEDLPQLPYSHFRLHFREGTRSPLASPPGCGTYNASARLTPWSGGAPITTNSTFQIITGPESGPCPSGGTPPFHPGLIAGTINNAAGSYSPFNLSLSRNDSEQEITHFSIKLPPGIVGRLAGIPYCSDAAIATAKARTGPHGGSEELESPSCPAASEVGRTLVGAGVGPSLAYAPGKLYLAGSYHGSNLSIVSITAAKVGPFDLGTVVVREALKINPETAEVFIDATGSDPIPHIIQGIPVHLRDIRAYVDRPNFVLNPTSCERTSTASTVLGSGLDFATEADDQPITVTSPFQAADCASLGFAPKLALSLKGGTRRGATPAFKARLTFPKGSQANIASAQVTLPHSVFLEQSHIRTICTRAQFAAGGGNGELCPPASIYGKAKAVTPILSEPLEGPVFLRASSHNLPDLVAALHNGQINIDLDGRIDSVKGGRIRNTFETVPDAPVTSFTLEMQGGKRGLLVNSTNLCARTHKALAAFVGQNGKRHSFVPVLKPSGCGGRAKNKRMGKGGSSKRIGALLSVW